MRPPPVRYATTADGKSIAYTVSGEGRPFVLVPPLFSHVQLSWRNRFYSAWYEGLTQNFCFVNYDPRGGGLSTRGLPADHSIGDWQLDLEAVLDAAGLDRVILMGGCHAGHIATRYAINHPERVEALVLDAVSISMSVWPQTFWAGLAQENWRLFLKALVPPGLKPRESNRMISDLGESMTREELAISTAAVIPSSLDQFLSRLGVPTLVLHPRPLAMLPIDESAGVAARIQGARFVLIDGDGLYGDAAQGIEAIKAFVKELAAAKAASSADYHLSRRQMEVLRLLANGKSNLEIADELVLSERTIERHVADLYAKIEVRNRSEATSFALSRNMLN